MNITKKTPNMIVIDDVLSDDERVSLNDFLLRDKLKYSMEGNWYRTFKTSDGIHLRGEAFYNGLDIDKSLYKATPEHPGMQVLVAKIDNLVKRLSSEELFSVRDWDTTSYRHYIYPSGSGLSWHSDHSYSISLIYYAHENWNINWGGELIVSEAYREENEIQNQALQSILIGDSPICIFPIPNRLVIIKANCYHCIKKVDNAAGDNFRESISIFLFKKERLMLKSSK